MTHFPYTHTPMENLRAHEAIRPEGTDPSQYWYQFWRGITYLKKYYSKSDRAPIEMLKHFEQQRRLLAHLRNQSDVAEATLGVFGDLMWIRDGWRSFLAPEAYEILARHEAILGNLETVMSPDLPVTEWLPDLVRYNSPREYLEPFRRPDGSSMLTALSTSNNHTLDFGDRGALDTLAVLDAEGIAHSGVRQRDSERQWVEVQAGAFRVGFVAATFGVNYPDDFAESTIALNVVSGLAPDRFGENDDAVPDLDRVTRDLTEMAEAGVDFRVVSIHWGFEYESHPSVRMMQCARDLVAAGADLVMGHHPHIQHPLEVLYVNQEPPTPEESVAFTLQTRDGAPRKAMVAYSLGNFTTTMVTDRCKLGLLLSLGLHRDPATQRVTWCSPKTQWFYNVAPFFEKGRGRRRLCPVEALDPDLARQINPSVTFARQHVDGS